jgi:hypothetical protein
VEYPPRQDGEKEAPVRVSVAEGVVILVAGDDSATTGTAGDADVQMAAAGHDARTLLGLTDLSDRAGTVPVTGAAGHRLEGAGGFNDAPASDRERFQRAATALLATEPDSDAARLHSIEAAAALLAAATGGDGGLGPVLRPDPDDPAPVTWTVACYQIGDLSPTTLKDFADPNEAVRAVAHCQEIAHVAAELLASSTSGLRWTAMVRTGDLLRFQLLGTGTAGNDVDAAPLEAVQLRWAEELPDWAAEAASSRSRSAPDGRAQQAMPAVAPEFGLAIGQILETVQSVARRVDNLATAREVIDRLNALEQRVIELQLQLGIGALVPSASRRPDLAAIDAEASSRPLPPGVRGAGAAEPAPRLDQRVSAALARAAMRRLSAARQRTPPARPTGWGDDRRGPGWSGTD